MDGTDPQTFSDSDMAGGANDDVLFGQLGNDWIQGDASAIDDLGRVTVNVMTRDTVIDPRTSVPIWAGEGTDGDDYVEGNGGDDSIWGDIGQDDLVGGSSLDVRPHRRRPNGSTASTRSTAARAP